MSRHPRKKRPWTASSKRPKRWQVVAVVSGVGLVTVTLLYLSLWPVPGGGEPEPDHEHPAARHGGVLVPLGDGERHFHVEAVLEKGGTLRLYTLQEDVSRVQEVDRQVLHATVKAAGNGERSLVTLVPSPQAGDDPGKTSQFVGRLPRELWGQELVVSIRALRLGDREHPVEFATKSHAHDGDEEAEDEKKLFLSPGGKYSAADIKANGNTTASRKYRVFQSRHDLKPSKGDRICPVTLTRANSQCSWIIADEKHLFCCPPCIGEFVRTAKERPDEIKAATEYVQH